MHVLRIIYYRIIRTLENSYEKTCLPSPKIFSAWVKGSNTAQSNYVKYVFVDRA